MAKKLYTTPRGLAVYPHLTKPDTKFDARGVYSTKFTTLDPADEQKLQALIDEKMQESLAAAKNEAKNPNKVKLADTPYTENEKTGRLEFNFKMWASGEVKKTGEKFTQKPTIFDASGTPITKVLRIGGATELKVSYEIVPFYTAKVGAGVTLRLKAVQILKLVEFGGANADYFGFDKEDGFSGNDAEGIAGAEKDSEDDAEGGTDTDDGAAAGSESADF
jgi:hypothetical protein